ncbi:Exocyst complex component EXO70B1 [Spatholobus suberectus]|nr:Exocyst complex component EXO70B1 [Spatholobus suberectus]
MGGIEVLKRKNGSVISMVSKHVDRCLKANVVDKDQIPVPQIDRDDNLVLDALRSDDDDYIVGDLGQTAMLMFTSSADFAFTEVCTELATRLLSTANALANSFRNTLEELLYEFELVFSGEYSKSLKKDARRVRKSLGIFMDSENLLTYGRGRLLPITYEVMNYIRDNSIDTKTNLKPALESIMLSPSVQVTRITRLFERSLKANFKSYSEI